MNRVVACLGIFLFIVGSILVLYNESYQVLKPSHYTGLTPDEWEWVTYKRHPFNVVGVLVGLVGFVTVVIGAYLPKSLNK